MTDPDGIGEYGHGRPGPWMPRLASAGVGFAVAGLVVTILLLLPGVALFPEQRQTVAVAAGLSDGRRAQAVNAGLQGILSDLSVAIADHSCAVPPIPVDPAPPASSVILPTTTGDKPTVLPGEPTSADPGTGSDLGTAAAGDPGQDSGDGDSNTGSEGIPADDQSEPQPDGRRLADLLAESTVFIMGETDEGEHFSGTGFFVAPGVVMTNGHVAGVDADGVVDVRSEALGTARIGRVRSVDWERERGSDFAVIDVDGDTTGLPVLQLSSDREQTDPVYVAGFPGIMLDRDVQYQRAINGDPSAVPSVSIMRGEIINRHIDDGREVAWIAHTAVSAPGNSGGPTVNLCGEVIGIHTAGADDQSYGINFKFALAAEAIAAFAERIGLTLDVRDERCAL